MTKAKRPSVLRPVLYLLMGSEAQGPTETSGKVSPVNSWC